MYLCLVTVYVPHQQTRLAHIRSHQKLDLDCLFRPLIINSQSSFEDIVGSYAVTVRHLNYTTLAPLNLVNGTLGV